MKRTVLLLLFVVMVLLPACGNKSVQPDYPVIPAAVVSADYQNIAFVADIKNTDDKYILTFKQPVELEGVSMNLNGENVTVLNDGISIEYSKYFLNNCPFAFLGEVLNAVNTLKPVFSSVNENLSAQFKVNDTDVIVLIDKKTEKIIKIQTNNSIFRFYDEVSDAPR